MPLATIEELTVSTCRWPLAEFERSVLLYCGEPVETASDGKPRSYCPRHAQLAYVRTAALRLPVSVMHRRVDRPRKMTETVA